MSAPEFEDYYYGLPGRPKLLARSNTSPWTLPQINGKAVRKSSWPIGRHPIENKLEEGLRSDIMDILSTMNPKKWISVDCLRLGYNREMVSKNPVVILITVEEDQVSPDEARRIVGLIHQQCTL
jgi:hypothetical protein